MIRIKICGVNDAGAFDAAVSVDADWLGFVFFAASPRAVTPAQAAALSARHAGGPQRVGLFVDPSDAEIRATLDVLRLDAVQLYASATRAASIRSAFDVPVWRSVAVAGADDLPMQSHGIDALVVEPRPPPGAGRPGGNAVALDWPLLAGWRPPTPWLLAGGLTPGNVGEAIRMSGATAVDVSSGVERSRGHKDADLIRAFGAAARALS